MGIQSGEGRARGDALHPWRALWRARMSAPGAPGAAAGPSTASRDSPLGPAELAALLDDPIALLSEDQAGALVEKLLGADEPRVAGVKRLLQDEEACGDTLVSIHALSLVKSDRWGEAVAVRAVRARVRARALSPHFDRHAQLAGASLLDVRRLSQPPGQGGSDAAGRASSASGGGRPDCGRNQGARRCHAGAQGGQGAAAPAEYGQGELLPGDGTGARREGGPRDRPRPGDPSGGGDGGVARPAVARRVRQGVQGLLQRLRRLVQRVCLPPVGAQRRALSRGGRRREAAGR